jgi:two-component system sensor histidine kinase TtrS
MEDQQSGRLLTDPGPLKVPSGALSRDAVDRGEGDPAQQEMSSLLALFHSSPDPVLALDARGRVQFASPAVEGVLGWEPRELVGLNFGVLLLEPVASELESLLAHEAEDAAPARRPRQESKVLHRDGGTVPCEVSVWPVTRPRPSGLRVVVSLHALTERKQAEERTRQQQAEFDHAARLSTVGEIADGLAHELNQPLAAITNYATGCVRRLRLGAGQPEDLLNALEQIAAQAMRAGEVIRRVRQSVRRRDPQKSTWDINSVVREVLARAEGDVRVGATHVDLDLAPWLPPLRADRIQIEQVLLQLLHNGLDALSTRAPEERVLTIRTSAAAADLVEVAVRDQGCGFPEDRLEEMFEAFFTTKSDGLGLGLAIGRSIAKDHGGRLWATRNADRGLTFHLVLPAHGGN